MPKATHRAEKECTDPLPCDSFSQCTRASFLPVHSSVHCVFLPFMVTADELMVLKCLGKPYQNSTESGMGLKKTVDKSSIPGGFCDAVGRL